MEELLAITGIFTFPLSIIFGVAWWNARKELQLRRDIAREFGVQPVPPRPRHVQPPTVPEIQRLEESIETLALEVERLSDGQRFVAKLLGERQFAEPRHERHGASSALPPVTPH